MQLVSQHQEALGYKGGAMLQTDNGVSYQKKKFI
jgi:hypothetical protein